jgi:hypothetical protein
MSETQTAPAAERGDLLRGAALATAGMAAAGLLSARPAQAATTGTPVTVYFQTSPGTGAIKVPNVSKNFATASIDVQVVNYALTLETLEAELYREAVVRLTGAPPPGDTSGLGTNDMFGNPISSLGASTSDPDVANIMEFAIVERQHRNLLTGVLGNNWVTDANVKFDFGLADTNNFGAPALTRQQAVQAVYNAELAGVSAYTGAVSLFTAFGVQNFLATAAAIAGVEGRHTAYLAAVISTINGSTTFNAPETTPQSTENNGREGTPTPDMILNQGAMVLGSTLTLPAGGHINPASGPSGFGGKGFVFK